MALENIWRPDITLYNEYVLKIVVGGGHSKSDMIKHLDIWS